MAESFNKLLLVIRGMPVNAIVQFTFYKLVAWFNDRHAHTLKLRSHGEIWTPKSKAHLEKANERAGTHEVTCFDHAIGTYQVEHRGHCVVDVGPLPHCLGPGGSVQLGLCSVGFYLPAAL